MNNHIYDLDEYQKEAMRTSPRVQRAYRIPETIYDALKDFVGDGDGADVEVLNPLLDNMDQMIWTLGLTGEAGEFADMMKKHHGHGHDLDEKKAAKELGDVLWYLSVLADSIGYSLSDIATMNVTKLRERYPNGFSIEESKDKKDLR